MGYKFNALTGQLDLVNVVVIPPSSVTSASGSSINNEVATFSGTSGTVIQTTPTTIDGSGNIVTPGTVTAAEIIDEGLTPNTAVYADSGSQLASSPTTSTELGYVHGVTSAIQTQLNALQPALTPGSISTSTTGVTVGNGSSSTVGPNVTVDVATASSSQTGLLDSTDWNTFNDKQSSGNYITALTGDVTASGPGSAVASLTATSNSTLTTLSSLNLPYSQLSGTVPTWNQNTTGTAANITATSNSTLTSLPSLSLPGSQVTGNISGNAANITATSNNTLTSLPSLVLPGSQVSGNIAGSAGSVSGTNVITNSNLAQMPANTILGNNTGSTENAADLTATQVTAMLNPFVGDTGSGGTQGLVPAPTSGTRAAGDFLSASGSFAYIDQSSPLYNPFSLVGLTQYSGSTIAKYENITTYTGIDGHKQYAAVVAGGTAGTLFIWDITDPFIPVLCSFVSLAGAYNISVAQISGAIYAFVPSSGSSVLYTINVTNPYALTTTSSLTITNSPGSLYSCVYANGYVYIATQNKGLTVVDVGGGLAGGTITVPVQAFQEGGTTNKSGGVAIFGNYVYTTNFQTTFPATVRYLKTWELAAGGGTLAVPFLANTYTISGGPTGTSTKPLGIALSPSGNTAYVTDGNQGIIDIIDVTTPTSPNYLTYITPSYTLADNTLEAAVVTVTVNGNYLYIPSGSNATNGGCVDLFDVTNQSSPIKVSSVYTKVPTDVFGGITLNNGYIFAADYGISGGYSNLVVFTQALLQPTLGATTATALTVTSLNTAGIVHNSATGVLSTSKVNLSTEVTGVLPVVNGGTGQSTFTDGQLLIGNTTGNTLTPATITGGSGVTVTNGHGSITISATGSGGTVTSVGLADTSTAPIYTVTNSPITGSGTLDLTLNTQSANAIFAGPSSGSAAQPSFRALVASDIPSLSSTYVTQSEVGANNGVAPLGASGKIDIGYLPADVFIYQGTWNPNTNTPVLIDGTGTAGYVYWVSAAYSGTVVGLSNPSMTNFEIGDLVLYNGTQWELTTPAAGVTSVNGAQGVVTVNAINQLTGDVTTSAASGSQSLTSSLVATSNSTLTTLSALSLPGSQVTGNISGNAANVTGTVAIANGGTGQTTASAAYNALSPMTTTGDMEYEVSSGTAARLPIGSTGQVLTVVSGSPAWQTPSVSGGTVTNVSVVSANGLAGTVATSTSTPAITLSTTVTGLLKGNGTAISAATAGIDYQAAGNYPIASGGDINETQFTAADNQSSPADVTGLTFANAVVRSADVLLSIVRGSTYAQYQISLVQGASSWYIDQTYAGDATGLTFSVTSAGQVQYTSTSTGSTANIHFRARTTSV